MHQMHSIHHLPQIPVPIILHNLCAYHVCSQTISNWIVFVKEKEFVLFFCVSLDPHRTAFHFAFFSFSIESDRFSFVQTSITIVLHVTICDLNGTQWKTSSWFFFVCVDVSLCSPDSSHLNIHIYTQISS